MHFAVVTENIPNSKFGGGSLTGWSVIKSLQKRGHRVTSCIILPAEKSIDCDEKNYMKDLEALGVGLSVFHRPPSRTNFHTMVREIKNVFPPSINTFYPVISKAHEISDAIEKLNADAVFAYDFAPVAATSEMNFTPRLGIGGSFRPLTSVYRWKHYTHLRFSRDFFIQAAFALFSGLEYRYMVKLLSGCQSSGHFAAHHAAALQKLGVKNCRYFHTPVVDMLAGKWQEFEKARNIPAKLKILMVGHLTGLSTLSGLYVLREEILPVLEKKLGCGNFEIHIIGKDKIPDDLKDLEKHPSVKFKGFVDDLQAEFASSHVCLVAGDVEFSVRVRVLTSFSFGACIVVHNANSPGIPEMVHGENVLIGNNGEQLAELIIRVFKDANLRKNLGRQARQTYEKCFSPEVAGGEIAGELEKLAIIKQSKTVCV